MIETILALGYIAGGIATAYYTATALLSGFVITGANAATSVSLTNKSVIVQ